MSSQPKWNALTDWKKTDIHWEKLEVSREDMKRFTKRNDLKGLLQAVGFLLFFVLTGGLAWLAFSREQWVWMIVALYFHGTFYRHFGDAIHEFSHRTVFQRKWLNTVANKVYGFLYWPWNPHLYRLSHTNYHHRYTLHQGSDGEDTPNYVELNFKTMVDLFLHCLWPTSLLINLARFVALKPTSWFWHYRGKVQLTPWEEFILRESSEKDRKQVYRFAGWNLIAHIVFVLACLVSGFWFGIVLISLAPFYGANWHSFFCSIHQHAATEPNHPDFRVSCGDVILDPLSSFLYWHMEYHIEHHSFAAIPCYNLKAFSRFAADQLPPKEHSLPRLLKLHKASKEKYGNYSYWRDHFGFYKEI